MLCLNNALKSLGNFLGLSNSMFEGIVVGIISGIISGIIVGIIVGIILYHYQSKKENAADSASAHDSTWTELPEDIWYSRLTGITPVDNSRLQLGGLTPEEQQTIKNVNLIKWEFLVDYPISNGRLNLAAYEDVMMLNGNQVDKFLPGFENQEWQISRDVTTNAPKGYIRERITLQYR